MLSFVIALLLLSLAIFLFKQRLKFFLGAKIYNAPIVKIEQQKRRKSIFTAYVPIVEIIDDSGAKLIREVNDYPIWPYYHEGDNIEVLYNSDFPNICIVNTFSETWGDVIYRLFFALVIFLPPLYTLYRKRNFYSNRNALYEYKSKLDTFKQRSLQLNSANPPTIKKRIPPLRRRHKKR